MHGEDWGVELMMVAVKGCYMYESTGMYEGVDVLLHVFPPSQLGLWYRKDQR